MKVIFFFSLLTISMCAYANDFGGLMPLPELGNKWEVLTVGTEITTKFEVVSVTNNSVTKRMKTEEYDIYSTTNYSVKNGTCYIQSIVSYDSLDKQTYHQKRVFSPALKCMISSQEMPYQETYSTEITDLNSGQASQEARDRTYYYRGIENIVTPAGKYSAEKIEITGSKMCRLQWRDNNNRLLKHQVDFYNTGKKTTTVLQKGRSQ